MVPINERSRAPRNRTINLSADEAAAFQKKLLTISRPAIPAEIEDRTIHQDLFEVLPWLPSGFVDLLFIDPPYNLTRRFNSNTFQERSNEEYKVWLETWLPDLLRVLKPTASVYVCGDWRSSTALHLVLDKHLIVRNRITWEREKGRGAKTNWKNCSEDIWFCTASENFTFNLDAVKMKRRVIAPYTDATGKPKDWAETEDGNYRITHPSNLWTDLSVPFWSMPENTDHPTQKPEKLLAKIILASSNPGDVVLDPFAGSGTTCVVAKKLGRKYAGIEIDETFCCLTEKRLAIAEHDKSIQGFDGEFFWGRNSLANRKTRPVQPENNLPLFNENF
jgi:site-specific DNA-methyltransferase (adenine-specific)